MSIDLLGKTKDEKWPNRIFFIFLAVLILGSVAFTYYRIMIKKDYLISAETGCDPYSEKCFIYVCDPKTEECSGDPEEDIFYYKIIKRKAYNIPLCDPEADENCEALICPEGEEDCSYELCEDGNSDGIECVDPVQYAIDNPEEEEEVECEEGDEMCLSEEIDCEEGDEECVNEEDESDENLEEETGNQEEATTSEE